MLLRDWRDREFLIRNMRSHHAQDRTDIQRLWRLVQRTLHEPNDIIGGGRGGPESSAPFPGSSSLEPPYPDPDPYPWPPGDDTSSASGGPEPPGPGADCCLWAWSGTAWVKLIDNTDGCTCPEPEDDGEYPGQMEITCCPDCSVVVDGCEIPCVIVWDVTADPDSTYWSSLNGAHTLTWNGVNDPGAAWEACEGSDLLLYNSVKISATYQDVAGVKSWTVWIGHYLTGDCSGGGPGVVTVGSDAATCVPVHGEGSEGAPPNGPNDWTIDPA